MKLKRKWEKDRLCSSNLADLFKSNLLGKKTTNNNKTKQNHRGCTSCLLEKCLMRYIRNNLSMEENNCWRYSKGGEIAVSK